GNRLGQSWLRKRPKRNGCRCRGSSYRGCPWLFSCLLWGALRRLRGAPALVGGFFELCVDDAFGRPAGAVPALPVAWPRAGLLRGRGQPRRGLRQLLGAPADQGGVFAADRRT